MFTHNPLSKGCRWLTALLLTFQLIFPPALLAQTTAVLPPPGTLVTPTPVYSPAMLNGLTVDAVNPLQFDFLINTGDTGLTETSVKSEAEKLIKYFLTALTIPENEIWVNLSPHEQDRIIPPELSQTLIGRDMLTQDYLLKQLTSSLMHPQQELGRAFWDNVHARMRARYGHTDLPTDSIHKIWIVPAKAVVYENGSTAYILESRMKVMLEEDYMAYKAGGEMAAYSGSNAEAATGALHEVLLPAIEEEVNTGQTFAELRQIYQALILASWYKDNLKEALLGQVYIDRHKTRGIESGEPEAKDAVYRQYLEALKAGVANIIQDEYDPVSREVLPRRYFTGGAGLTDISRIRQDISAQEIARGVYTPDAAMLGRRQSDEFAVRTVLLENIGQSPVVLNDADSRDFAMLAKNPLRDNDYSIADEELRGIFSGWRSDRKGVIYNVTLEAFMEVLGAETNAQRAQAAGGLGFLMGEDLRAAGESDNMNFGHIGVMPLYERTQDGSDVDWEAEMAAGRVKPLMIQKKGEEPRQLELDIGFRNNAEHIKASFYWINANGTPVIGIRAPQIFGSLYMGELYSRERIRQYGFLGRAFVEVTKQLNRAAEVPPSILRFNEGQLLFVHNAVVNDIEYYRGMNEVSVFDNSWEVITTHSPEGATMFHLYGDRQIDQVKEWIGSELIKEPNYTNKPFEDGEIDGLVAMAKSPRVAVINAVSQDHGDVTHRVILPEEFSFKLVGIQNGSHPEQWRSDELNKLLAEKESLQDVTAEELFSIGQINKIKLVDELREIGLDIDLAGVDVNRPFIGLLRRWVRYKSQDLIIPLLTWMMGDPAKEFTFRIDNTTYRKKGLGANVFLGGKAQDTDGHNWMRQFQRLKNDLRKNPNVVGKLVIVQETGIWIMQLFTSAMDLWLEFPWPTREASGTSGQRAAFNGTPGLYSPVGHQLVWVENGENSWMMDIDFRTDEEKNDPNFKRDVHRQRVVEAFQRGDPEIISQYYSQARHEMVRIFEEFTGYYRDFQSGQNPKWGEMMVKAFRDGHEFLSIEEMVHNYDMLFASVMRDVHSGGFIENQREREDVRERVVQLRQLVQTIISANTPDMMYRMNKNQLIRLIGQVELSVSRDLVISALIETRLKLQAKGIDISELEIDSALERLVHRRLYVPIARPRADPELLYGDGDSAMLSPAEQLRPAVIEKDNVGGIDFSRSILNLEIRRDDEGVPLPLGRQPLKNMRIDGFTPVIINIQPVINLPLLLGIRDDNTDIALR